MGGTLGLLGSGEYLDVMNEIDRRLLAESGRAVPRVVCLPTAAGQEGRASIERWSRLGVDHFRALGAEVEAPAVIDRATADDPANADRVRDADLIYFSGGDPNYLFGTLNGSRVWQAVEAAHQRGAALAGCSAGAMIVGRYIPDRFSINFGFTSAFGWIADCLILPHFDRLPLRRLIMLLLRRKLKDGMYALGLDENTALIGRLGGEWQVMGASNVSLVARRETKEYPAGSRLSLPKQRMDNG